MKTFEHEYEELMQAWHGLGSSETAEDWMQIYETAECLLVTTKQIRKELGKKARDYIVSLDLMVRVARCRACACLKPCLKHEIVEHVKVN